MSAALPTIETSHGPVIGFADTLGLRDHSAATPCLPGTDVADEDGGKSAVWKWLGIPYAEAGRWERPRDPPPWTEAKCCFEFGTMFHQPGGLFRFSAQRGWMKREWVKSSEDSHYVNIYSPPNVRDREELPVLVWIYGGTLNNGSSDRFLYDATDFVRRGAENGERFIVVTGNYRTNIFGFFSTSELLAQDPEGLSGNYGLYDIIFLLQWVQKNISSFGGSSSNITIFGGSAGAFLISYLLVSGKRLFRRAIMQSGAPESMSIRSPSESYRAHDAIVSAVSSSNGTVGHSLDLLRRLPAQKLYDIHAANHTQDGLALTLESGPHAVWKGDVLEKISRGEWDPWIEDVMVGTNEDEATYFLANSQFDSPALFEHFVSLQPPHLRSAIKAKYSSSPSTEIKTTPTTLLLNDSLFFNPAFSLAAALSSVPNAKKGSSMKVFMYRCRAPVDRLSKDVDPDVDTGVLHATEVPLIFNLNTLWEKGSHEEAASKAFGTLWFNFALTGVPDKSWQPFTIEAPSWFAIDHEGSGANEDLTGWEVGRIDFTGRGFCLPKATYLF